MRIHLFFAMLLLFMPPLMLEAQTANDKIDPKDFNREFLARLIQEKINKVRDSLGLQKLEWQQPLEQAAIHHANYIKKTGKLSHDEKRRRFSNPGKRVKAFGGKYDHVSENIAFVSAGPTMQRGRSKTFTFDTYSQIAEKLVNNWVKSPGHLKNILTPGLNYTGVGISYDISKNFIYAVQVFTQSQEVSNQMAIQFQWFRI